MIDFPDFCKFTHNGVGQSKSSAVGACGKLAVIFQVPRRQAIQQFVNENSQLEPNTLLCYYQGSYGQGKSGNFE